MPIIRAPSFRKPSPAALLAFMPLLFLSGCVTPNVFTAVLTLEKNGDYHLAYSGTFYEHNLVMKARGKNGAMAGDLHDRDAGNMVDALSANPFVFSCEYIGNGLFNVCFQIRGNVRDARLRPERGAAAGDIFTLEELPAAGEIRFAFTPMLDSIGFMRSTVEALADEVDGRIEVYTELPVVKCDGDPGAPPGARTAVWRVKGWEKGQKPLTMTFSRN